MHCVRVLGFGKVEGDWVRERGVHAWSFCGLWWRKFACAGFVFGEVFGLAGKGRR